MAEVAKTVNFKSQSMPHFQEVPALAEIAEQLYDRLVTLKTACQNEQISRRCLVAVAGVPGSGKSTVTAALAKLFLERQGRQLTILPMVGRYV
jgi:Mrp family chromosome partitioning ATPase